MSGRFHGASVRVRALDVGVGLRPPAVDGVEGVAVEQATVGRIEDAWSERPAVEGVATTGEVLEGGRSERRIAPRARADRPSARSGVVIRDHHDGLGGLRPEQRTPRRAPIVGAVRVAIELGERAQDLLDGLGAADVHVDVKEPLAVTAGRPGQRRIDADGVVRAAAPRLSEGEQDHPVVETAREELVGEGVDPRTHLGDRRCHAARIVDHPDDVDGQALDHRRRRRRSAGGIGIDDERRVVRGVPGRVLDDRGHVGGRAVGVLGAAIAPGVDRGRPHGTARTDGERGDHPESPIPTTRRHRSDQRHPGP